MGRQGQRNATDPVQAGLESIKRLLMLMLLKAGTTQGEIAAALGVDQSVISRMLPARKIRKTNG